MFSVKFRAWTCVKQILFFIYLFSINTVDNFIKFTVNNVKLRICIFSSPCISSNKKNSRKIYDDNRA